MLWGQRKIKLTRIFWQWWNRFLNNNQQEQTANALRSNYFSIVANQAFTFSNLLFSMPLIQHPGLFGNIFKAVVCFSLISHDYLQKNPNWQVVVFFCFFSGLFHADQANQNPHLSFLARTATETSVAAQTTSKCNMRNDGAHVWWGSGVRLQ